MKSDAQELEVGADAGRPRLDVWLVAQVPDVSRSQIARAVAQGRVHVNGTRPRKVGQRLDPGDRITYQPPPPRSSTAEPQDLSVPLVHVDEWLAVVDKPAGLVVHPGDGHPDGTLVNGLLHLLGPLSTFGSGERPGIVHRLDRDTSGLLVAARDDVTHRALAAQFEARTVFRRYLAVVLGPRMDDVGVFDTPYGRHPKHRKKMTGRFEADRRAITHWEVVARGDALALMLLRLRTGRTHQIRVHLAESGHPVVADPLYGRAAPKRGGGGRTSLELAAARRMPRLALHAAALGFDHPGTGEAVRWIAEPPEDLSTLITASFGAQALDETMARIRGTAL